VSRNPGEAPFHNLVVLATHVGKPLPFGETKLASLQVLRASAELFFARTRSSYLMVDHPAIFAVSAQDASFTQ
jgi:hypothetical protein